MSTSTQTTLKPKQLEIIASLVMLGFKAVHREHLTISQVLLFNNTELQSAIKLQVFERFILMHSDDNFNKTRIDLDLSNIVNSLDKLYPEWNKHEQVHNVYSSINT